MNSKVFTHFMNRIDNMSEKLHMIQHELDMLKRDLEKEKIDDG